MNSDDLDNKRILAEIFRRAIETYIKDYKPYTWLLRIFPRENCQLASCFLQKFLYENGIKTFLVFGPDYVGEGESHAWLVTEDEIIIDITGDQYKMKNNQFKYNVSVYVGPMDSFHSLFNISEREPYKEPIPDPFPSQVEINNNMDYERIKKIALRFLGNE